MATPANNFLPAQTLKGSSTFQEPAILQGLHPWSCCLHRDFWCLLKGAKCSVWLSYTRQCFFFFFLRAPSPFVFLVIGSPKDQLPTACLCNRNAYAPRAIRTYIFSLLQVGYQTCAPRTMIMKQYMEAAAQKASILKYNCVICTNDDWNIDHRKWLKKMSSLQGPTLKKN